jgi:hypothetical protein
MLNAPKTTFAAALSDSIHRRYTDRESDTVIVKLLLTHRHFPAQPSSDDVLSVIFRAVLCQLLRLAYQGRYIVTDWDRLRATLAAGLNFHVVKSLLKDLLRLWRRSFLIFDDISDVPTIDLCHLFSRLADLGFHSVIFVGSPLNTLTQGITCFCDVDDCPTRQTST